MVPSLRKAFNESFSTPAYQAFLKDLNGRYPGAIEFRIAETPVFVPKTFAAKLHSVCDHIIDLITDPGFKMLTEGSIPRSDRMAGENSHSHFLVFDFAVCADASGDWAPQLIEMQGFPSLYGFQVYEPDLLRHHFAIPSHYSQYLGSFDRDSYLDALREVILGGQPPEHTILLELKPHEQKTRIDFYCTRDYLGIQPICLTELRSQGRKLFYTHPGTGRLTEIRRIYNRIIFDELHHSDMMQGVAVDIREDWDVEWITHPHWFYRISKYTLPFLRHPYIPQTYFLHDIRQLPPDLDQYVLKPLFSFAGQGVLIDVTKADLEKIDDPENWILQRKVTYADLIPTPDVPARVEIRMMYLWKDGEERPFPAINLARLSKGKMIGVRYNQDKTWVGGSVCFFER